MKPRLRFSPLYGMWVCEAAPYCRGNCNNRCRAEVAYAARTPAEAYAGWLKCNQA